jgi:hypothetical protein
MSQRKSSSRRRKITLKKHKRCPRRHKRKVSLFPRSLGMGREEIIDMTHPSIRATLATKQHLEVSISNNKK